MTTLTLVIDLTDAQTTGVAQARTAYNATLPEGAPQLTDTEYLQYVLIGAANSYAAQYSGSEPVPPSPVISTIDWIGLITELEPYFNIGLAVNYPVFTQCLNMLVALKRTPNFDDTSVEWRNFAFNLNLGKDAFSAQQKTEIEAVFAGKDVPFIFDI
jgi:hypothetical protein